MSERATELYVMREYDPARLWREYAEAIGAEELKKAYGDDWPRLPGHAESVFLFFGIRDTAGLQPNAGWGCLRHDVPNHLAWLLLGVWPEFQKQSWSTRMSHWLVDRAFDDWDIDAVCIQVLRSNEEYLKSKMRRIDKSPWKHVGHLDVPPPGCEIFGVRRSEWGFWKDKGKCEI